MQSSLAHQPDEASRNGQPSAPWQHRLKALPEATAAACAVVAFADGEALPAERDKAIAAIGANPMMSVFPPDALLRAFQAEERAFREGAPAARVSALRRIEPLARDPGQARKALNACLALTGVDGRMHPREITAVKQVRDALGLGPDRRLRTRAVLAAAILAAAPGPSLAAATGQMAAASKEGLGVPVAASPFALDAPADEAFQEVLERLRAAMPQPSAGNPDQDFVSGATATLTGTVELAQYVLHHGHDPALRRLARSAIAESQKHLVQLRRWQARHGEKHVEGRREPQRLVERTGETSSASR